MNAAVLNRLRHITMEEVLDSEPERVAFLKNSLGIENVADLVVNYMTLRWERIERLGMSDRVVCRLKRWLEIETVGDIYKHTARDVWAVPGLGKKAIEEIEQALADNGFPSLPK